MGFLDMGNNTFYECMADIHQIALDFPQYNLEDMHETDMINFISRIINIRESIDVIESSIGKELIKRGNNLYSSSTGVVVELDKDKSFSTFRTDEREKYLFSWDYDKVPDKVPE